MRDNVLAESVSITNYVMLVLDQLVFVVVAKVEIGLTHGLLHLVRLTEMLFSLQSKQATGSRGLYLLFKLD